MTDTDPDEGHLELLSSGVYLHGCYLEGARWDTTSASMKESQPRTLFAKMPILWLEPTDGEIDNDRYECPVYKISSRAGSLSTTGLSTNFILNVHLHPGERPTTHWVLRGAAMLTTLDD